MAAFQSVWARIGWVTGEGLAANMARGLPHPLVGILVLLLFVANTVNIGADLAAIGVAAGLVLGFGEAAFAVPARRTWQSISDTLQSGADQPPSALSALRITATSIASWMTAPCTGVMYPSAAAIMPASERPIPAATLSRAIRRDRRAINRP